jgi:hypothetical protein
MLGGEEKKIPVPARNQALVISLQHYHCTEVVKLKGSCLF